MFKQINMIFRPAALAALLGCAATLSSLQGAPATPNLLLWDTATPLADPADGVNRTAWKAVPTDLLALEADPLQARSDPGFYGRKYAFKGDAVVETRHWLALFCAAKGRVVVCAREEVPLSAGASSTSVPVGRRIIELAPLPTKTLPGTISRVEPVRHVSDELALEVTFSAPGTPALSAVFTFDKSEILEVKPAKEMKGLSLLGTIEYGVAPSFLGDDLIYAPADYPSAKTLCVPAENLFLGLLRGEDRELVLTWPKGRQQMKLQLDHEQGQLITSIDFDNDGQSVYLATLGAPGLWHKETLGPSFLEKDVTSSWQRPFPARWKTQLSEAGTKTTFTFRAAKGHIWRGVPGSYNYPVWFDGNKACYSLSKKVPPKGDALVYFVEGQDTPPAVATPVEMLKATLGRAMCEPILDVAGRSLRTHHRRGEAGVRRACTCGCTEAIQAVFEAGEEVKQKEFIAAALEDMMYFVRRHLERIEEYRRFADDALKLLQARGGAAPELKPFLDELEQIVRQIPQECEVQKENMKSLAHAEELSRRTLELSSKKTANNLKAYVELLKAWRGMGGAQDYVVAQCHTITRQLCQAAGYGCVNQPQAVAVAEEIRARCRQCLRNPDGYEIWADY